MGIARHGVVEGEGLPRISKVVVHGDTAYVLGVTSDPVGDVRAQTRQVLDRIDKLLASVGSSKSKVLSAQVWLTAMADFAAHNSVWNEWVDPANAPVRACVGATLFRPGLLVEIMVVAAR